LANLLPSELPLLPLVLWDTPPALELVLAQEGVPYRCIRRRQTLFPSAGRFVLFDSSRTSPNRVRGLLSSRHTAIDVHLFRQAEPENPFDALVDNKAARASWLLDGVSLTERVARVDKSAVRSRLIERLRAVITQAGGIWARLSPYPFPYRSAFGFRADLDEPIPEDYFRFGRARRGMRDCTTHFVSTRAYGDERAVLADLRELDTQSHGHFHVIYRDPEANRRNLNRAHDRLVASGIDPVGFAAPEGRWNPGLDSVLEELGYLYSSDFQVGYDDLPFYPWRDGRFSNVLQVPIHPVCEGLFLEAGVRDSRLVGSYLASVVRAKLKAGEPAFVYGHPERRLASMPDVLDQLAAEVSNDGFVWRVTLTDFARWWRWRGARSWAVVPKGGARIEIQFDEWDSLYPLSLQIFRGEHVASVPVRGPLTALRLDTLVYERRRPRAELASPRLTRLRRGFKDALRAMLDWETVTPIEELSADSLRARLKRGLRHWRAARAAAPRRRAS
jgi:hypothetical protein